jgi:hypothetical protein
MKTLDRRRVDPQAGCLVTAEPAILTGRWSAEMHQLKNNRRTTESPLAAHASGRGAAKRFFGAWGFMTCFGMYSSQTDRMMNIELARILQAEREREIEMELRTRRLLRSAETAESIPATSRSIRQPQRAASTGATCR